jgi:hypothetical protein
MRVLQIFYPLVVKILQAVFGVGYSFAMCLIQWIKSGNVQLLVVFVTVLFIAEKEP